LFVARGMPAQPAGERSQATAVAARRSRRSRLPGRSSHKRPYGPRSNTEDEEEIGGRSILNEFRRGSSGAARRGRRSHSPLNRPPTRPPPGLWQRKIRVSTKPPTASHSWPVARPRHATPGTLPCPGGETSSFGWSSTRLQPRGKAGSAAHPADSSEGWATRRAHAVEPTTAASMIANTCRQVSEGIPTVLTPSTR
jgi:hypothetical protein